MKLSHTIATPEAALAGASLHRDRRAVWACRPLLSRQDRPAIAALSNSIPLNRVRLSLNLVPLRTFVPPHPSFRWLPKMRLPAMWAFDRKRDTWQGFKDDCLGIQAGLYR